MPCSGSPLRLLESPASHGAYRLNTSVRRAFTCCAQPLLAPKPSRAETTRRRTALNRLQHAIDPNDLVATLEAHRQSNKSSLIQRVPTKRRHDPEILRPSFLADRAHDFVRPISDAVNARDRPRASASKPGDFAGQSSHRSIKDEPPRTFVIQAKEHSGDGDVGRGMEQARREFLCKYERPLRHTGPVNSRFARFDTMRRVRAVLQIQTRDKTNRPRQIPGTPSDILEYTGSHVPLKTSPFATPMIEPWARPTNSEQSRRQRLEAELDQFAEWMEPLPGELAAREKVYTIVTELVQQQTPGLATEKFGSQLTGLVMPGSDVDVRVFPKHLIGTSTKWQDSKAVSSQEFIALFRALKHHPDFSLVVQHTGKYPLIGATHMATGLAVQLVAASSDTSQSRAKTQQYLAEWPTLKPLYTLIKTALDMRGLSDVWLGGLGSYSIFMMIVASLKLNSSPCDPATDQLLRFLAFYGSLDTYQHGLAIEPQPLLFRKADRPPASDKAQPQQQQQQQRDAPLAGTDRVLHGRRRIQKPAAHQRYLLCLQDPADPYNDLGKKSFAIKDVQATLKHLHAGLESSLAGEGRDALMAPLIRKLVGRCDQLYDRRRAALELFGDGYLGPGV